ncbi:hypothetical protein [Rheinheimera sp.]|uniref:hypothetical protein n=1 Tax=Rheinheimera sp. TaxID=1869214 RepID=UPI00307D62BC
MIATTVAGLLVLVFVLTVHITLKLLKKPDLARLEDVVTHEFGPRAHRLCLLAYESQRPVNADRRELMEEQFQDDLYEYMEDYQIEVAQRLRQQKFKGIQAYGYVRL